MHYSNIKTCASAATPPATPGGASVASMSSLGGFRSNSMSSGHFPPNLQPSHYLASRSHASPGGPPGEAPLHALYLTTSIRALEAHLQGWCSASTSAPICGAPSSYPYQSLKGLKCAACFLEVSHAKLAVHRVCSFFLIETAHTPGEGVRSLVWLAGSVLDVKSGLCEDI